jgi:hypothetical protein
MLNGEISGFGNSATGGTKEGAHPGISHSPVSPYAAIARSRKTDFSSLNRYQWCR